MIAAAHPHNAWQCRHIGNLLDGGQEAALAAALRGCVQLVEYQRLEAVVDVKLAGHPHAGHHALLDAKSHRRLLLDVAHLLRIAALQTS